MGSNAIINQNPYGLQCSMFGEIKNEMKYVSCIVNRLQTVAKQQLDDTLNQKRKMRVG